MKEWVRVLRAADAVAKWHVHQRRKGPAAEPYVNHLLEVATLVAEATEGNDPDLIIAALLHDAIEDQEVPYELIATEFGNQVASIVLELTDDKTLDKSVRKQKQEESSASKSRSAKILKLADKTSNLRALAASAPADWSVRRRLEYVDWAERVARGLRGTNDWLEGEFDDAAAAARGATMARRIS